MFWWMLSALPAIVWGDVHIGRAVNVFKNFGDLSATVKVDPHNTNWFFDHDSVDIFQEVLETRSPSFPVNSRAFNGDFHMQLCDDIDCVKAAYFSSWSMDGCDKPCRGFLGGWSTIATSRHLGINTTYVTGPHSYALVRLTRTHQLVEMSPDHRLRLNNWTADGMDTVIPGESSSVLEYVRESGSHYVSSYTTGDSLYQVFVFTPSVYGELQEVVREYQVTQQGLDRVLDFFTPWHVEHIGRIVSCSRNPLLEEWAADHLLSQVMVFVYSSLLNLHRRPKLLQELNVLMGNDALLSIDLNTVAPFFKDETRRLWFQEVMDNQLKIWDVNI